METKRVKLKIKLTGDEEDDSTASDSVLYQVFFIMIIPNLRGNGYIPAGPLIDLR